MSATFWETWRCQCRKGNQRVLVRTDRNLKQLEIHCYNCKTTVKTEIVTIEYSI